MTGPLPRLVALFALIGFVSAQPVNAQTWTGATSTAWGNAANWSTAIPGSGNTALFNGAGNGNIAIDLGGVARPIGSMLFDTANAAAYTFSGNAGDALRFDSGGAITINPTVTTAQTFGSTLQLQGALTATNNGTGLLTFNGNTALVTGSTAGLFTIGGTGNTQLNGILTAGSVSGLTKTGAGQLTIPNIQTYTGGTTISGGSIRITNPLVFQSSTVTIASANGLVFDASAGTAFTLGGLAGAAGAGNLSLLNTAAAPITLTIGNNNLNTTYSGTMSGALANLVKVGTGVSTLTGGTSSFTGNVTVNQGTLAASTANNGANSSLGARIAGRTITVNPGATLQFNTNNIFGGGGNTAATLPSIIVNNATVFSTRFNMLPDITLNGSLLNQASTDTAGGPYQGYQLIGTVTVGGTSMSTIGTTNGRGTHLLGTGTKITTFNVADATGDSNTDLLVTTPVLNGSGDYGGGASNSILTKNGLGTMRLAVGNTNTTVYSGATNVNAGSFYVVPTAISSAATAIINVADGATFGVFNATTQTVTANTVNVGTITGGRLALELAGNTTLAPLTVTTALNPNGTGNLINVATSVGFTVGQFPLIAYPAGGIGGSGFGGFALGSLPYRVTAGLVNNTATSTIDLNVTATDSIRWTGAVNADWNTSTQNWITNTTATPTNYLQPSIPGEPVLFNDLAAGNFNVNIPATVNPASVTVDNTTNNYTFSGAAIGPSGAFTFTKSGTGTLTILNDNTFGGSFTINAGSVVVGNGGTNGSIGSLPGGVVNNGSLTFNKSNNLTIGSVISGGGSLIKAGSGDLNFTAIQTYTGGTTVNAGTLTLSAGNNGQGVVKGILTINAGATVLVNIHDAFGYASAATGLNNLNIVGGTIDKLPNTGINETLTGVAISMTGGLMAGTGGYWDLFTNGFGDCTVATVPSATTATISGQLNFRSATTSFTVPTGTAPGGIDLLVSGALTGGFGMTKEGSGTMVITGVNTYTGTTTINGGTLQLGNGTASGSLGNTAITINTSFVLNPGTAGSTVTGAIGGPGTVTKIGPNLATLTGLTTYTGDTTISAGTLRFKPAATTSAAVVHVLGGARLTVASFDTASTVLSVATLNAGLGAAGGQINFELVNATTLAPLQVTTALNTAGTNVINISSANSPPVGQFPLIAYPGTIGGAGYASFTLGTLPLRVLGNLVNNTANSTIDLNVTGTDTIRWNGLVPGGVWDINSTPNWRAIVSNTDTVYLQPTVPGDIVTFNDLATGTTNVTIPATVSPASLTVDNSTLTYSFSGAGDIAGAIALVKNGTGTLQVANNNTYTGGTVINAGTLIVGNGGTFGNLSTGPITNSGSLVFNRSDNISLTQPLTGTGSLTQAGPGTLTLPNFMVYTGETIVTGGILLFTAGGNGNGNIRGTLTINTGGTVNIAVHDVFGYANAANTLSVLNINGGLIDKLPGSDINETLTGVTVNFTGGTMAGTGGYWDIFQNGYGNTNFNTNPTNTTATISASLNFRNVSPVFTVAAGSTPSGIDLLVTGLLTDSANGNAAINGFTKLGDGNMTLVGTHNYRGTTQISAGTLQLGNGTTSGAIAGTIINDSVLAFNPAPAGQTFAVAINGAGSVSKIGPNTLSLTGANVYTGATNVNGGTLRASPNALPFTTTVNVADGARFGVFNAAAGALSIDTLNTGTTTGAGLNFDLAGPTTVAPLSITNAFSTVGVSTINVTSSLPLAIGQFPLIQYSASGITGAGFAGLTTGTLPLRVVGTIVNNTVNNTVDLNITAIDTPRWNGNIDNVWDINTTQNWRTVVTNAPTTYLQPTVPGDNVIFNDQAVGNFSVSIPAAVSPTSVTVNNTTNAYTFNGQAITGTSGLIKSGTNSLTLLNNNTYTGTTSIAAGTINVGNGGTTGSLGTGEVANNASLVFNRSDAVVVANLISGTGTVTHAGTGSTQLTNLNNSFSGNLVINSGTLIAALALNPTGSANSSLGAQVGGRQIIVNAGGTLSMPSNNTFLGGGGSGANRPTLVINGGVVTSTRYNALPDVILNGGLLTQASTDPAPAYMGYQFLGTVTVGGTDPSTIASTNNQGNHLLPAGTTFDVADVTGGASPSLYVTTYLGNGSGDYGGAGNMTKIGLGEMLLAGANTFTGAANVNAGTLTVSGSLDAASTVNVATAGTLAGRGIMGNATLDGNGVIRLDSTGRIAGTLAVTGGNWTGLGTVTGAVTVNSGVFNVSGSLTNPGGMTVVGGTLAGSGTITGSVNYNSTSVSTFAGNIAGTGNVAVDAVTGELVLNGVNTYSGTTTVTSGTLTLNNSLSGPGGAITINDGAILQARGSLQRPLAVSGANQTGMIRANGNLAITATSGTLTFDGHLNTQGNFVQMTAPGDVLVRSISMSQGAVLTTGTAIKLANNPGNFGQGETGVAYINGNVTIGGTFWAGRVTNDSAYLVGAGNTLGDSVTFTGVLRGSLNSAGVNIIIQGLDKEGWSPTFSAISGANFVSGAAMIVVNSATPYTPNTNTWLPTASGGGYTQRLVGGYIQNSITSPGTYTASASTSYIWDSTVGSGSHYDAAIARKGDAFTIVRTDASKWGTGGTTQNIDGSIVGFEFITLPNGTTGGNAGSFQNLPALPTGLFWHVEANAQKIELYVGGFLPFGDGVWKNGNGNSNWSLNTAANNNWGTAQPFAAGQIATFDGTVTNFNAGIVNVDAPQTLGGIIFNKSGPGYVVGANGGNALTLDNGTNAATIIVSDGSHTVAAPIALNSNLSVSVTNAADVMTLSGGVSGSGRSLTKNGPGNLILNGSSTYSGATTVNAGTLTINNALTGPGGTITIADGATLAASGTIQRTITVSGTNQTGAILANGNLTIVQTSGGITFDGHLLTQGNAVQYATAGDALVRSISMSTGANLSSGTAIKLANNPGNFSQGETGVAYISGSVTIGGTFWAGRVTNDSAYLVGAGNPSGDKVTFTGVLRGSLNSAGVDIVIEGLDKEGWSPTFAVNTGANFTASGTIAFSANTPAQYTPNANTWPPTVVAGSGGHTQRLLSGFILNGGTPVNATYIASSSTAYQWNADSTYSVATAVKGDTFTIVRTDGSAWGTGVSGSNTRVNIDGAITGFNFITLPNGVTGGSAGSFQNLPALTIPGQYWHVDATAKRIALYVGGFLPYGSGVWRNGANNGNWSVNTAADNNWGTAQPFWAGHVATFDNTVINFAGGAVTVDAAQTVGGLLFNKPGPGYTISGSPVTLDNGAGTATLAVTTGSHTVATPLVLASNLLVSVDAAGDSLTISNSVSGAGRSLTKAGPGTLVFNGVGAYTGGTVVNGGTFGGTGSLGGSVTVNTGRIRGGSGTGTGVLTTGGFSTASGAGITANLAATGVSSRVDAGSGLVNLSTGSVLQLIAVPGFAGTNASYTLASGSGLQLDTVGVADGFVYGTFTQGVGVTGPVTIDVTSLGFALQANDAFQLSRSGNNLVLNFTTNAIPEPAVLLLGALAVAGIARRRRGGV